jgi:nucleoside-diphosphate-sugar epimerase
MSKNRLEMPSVLITGANGWLGRSAISVLTERYPNKFRIYALTRNKRNLSDLHIPSVQVINYDEVQHIDLPITGLIHTAFKTQSYIAELTADRYKVENSEILNWLDRFLIEKNPAWAISISSGAAKTYSDKLSKGEPLNSKDLYGELKVQEEQILTDSLIPNIAIGRLWAASGRYMQNHKIYALGEFIEKAFLDVLLNCAWTNPRTLIDSGGVLTTIESLASLVVNEIAKQTGSKVQISVGNEEVEPSNQEYFPKSNRFNLLLEQYGIVGLTLEQQIERTAIAVRERLDVTQK